MGEKSYNPYQNYSVHLYSTNNKNMTRQENKQLYLELLQMVNGKFPIGFADKVKIANPTIKISTITNVRYGRAPKLDVLIFMIRVLMPGFLIPEKFLNAEKEISETAA